LIVLTLTAIVAVILILTVFSLLISEIWYPDRDLGMLADRIATIVSSLIAAIVGYLAGRGVNGTTAEKP
jgi:Na+/H+ antiporter NhaA